MLTRRSFFGVVVAGASALMVPRRKHRVVDVPVCCRITYAPGNYDAHLERLRKQFAEIVQHMNNDSDYVPILPAGVERIEFVSGPYNAGPAIIRFPETTRVRVA